MPETGSFLTIIAGAGFRESTLTAGWKSPRRDTSLRTSTTKDGRVASLHKLKWMLFQPREQLTHLPRAAC